MDKFTMIDYVISILVTLIIIYAYQELKRYRCRKKRLSKGECIDFYARGLKD